VIKPLKDKGRQNGFLHYWTGCYECNNFFDFLKHFEAIGMDGSSNEMLRIAFGFTVDELEGF
jgi:hypothetical protein